MRFTDFVNLHRISHAIILIRQGQAFNWSLEGLANQCGFNNRNSFREAFKRFTGHIPSDYLKNKNAVPLLRVYKKAG
ncbi:AraC family transcriptional regulator [Paraflavitalea soli]|uniref:AraC family transcriptional regulator n=1 Tax=Paraflavitalea soli TaxID=2315862 RepID=A0A3B7MLE6_9BACT|nr:helix-turn-helix domain-containing protein [Paraflavitalea soli]AXY75314.1 AraC family transcriptional regulator [Paraflavitalea soli]